MIAKMIAAALLMAQAVPDETPCLTRAEVSDFALNLAPVLVRAVAQRCRSHLPADAFLNSGWGAYEARLEAEAPAHRAAALRVFARLAGGEPVAPEQQSAAMQLMTSSLVAGVDGVIPLESCPDVDRILGALAPLPPENLGALIGSLFALSLSSGVGHAPPAEGVSAGRNHGTGRNMRICPA
jgi:hypothetical protein